MSNSASHALSSISCPSCRGALSPTQLHCEPCDLSVQGRFELSEFASLGDEELHFLRIFVHCEGSIREMESALGLSYPTIKSRLANLKKRLSLDQPTSAPNAPRRETVGDVLSALESGEISHAESVKFIKAIKSKAGEK